MTRRPTRGLDLDYVRILVALGRTAADLERQSIERLGVVLRASADVPFYARRMADAGMRPAEARFPERPLDVLHALPPVTKRDLQDAGHEAVAHGRLNPSWRSTVSSGSTGEPLRVYYDRRAWIILKYLVKYRARAACGLKPHHRAAMLDAIPTALEGRTALERLGRLRRISVFRDREDILAYLGTFAPHWIYGLPSVLADVASLSPAGLPGLQPRGLFTSGEILLASTKRLLQSAYHAPVFDVYGCTETKEIAWECRAGSMHVNCDVVRLEVLDDRDRPVPPGTEGHLVATLLVNRAMPLLRYRTGDRGALLGGPCRCGSSLPLLGVVTGREADLLRMGPSRRISPYAITCALERIPGLRQYHVTQLASTWLRVQAVLRPGTAPDPSTHAITAELERAVGLPVTVTVDFVDRITLTSGTKFKVVEGLRDG